MAISRSVVSEKFACLGEQMSHFHSSLYSLYKETKRAVKFAVGFQRTILLLRRFLKEKDGLSLLLSADLLTRTVGKHFSSR
ncbi:hypothetical protein CL631_02435 [bacterium]|nr:hypothetical protein [bacterium]